MVWEVSALFFLEAGRAGVGLLGGLWIRGFDHTSESTAGGKFSRDRRMQRSAGFHDIVQDSVDGVLIEDSEISVRVEVHFQ